MDDHQMGTDAIGLLTAGPAASRRPIMENTTDREGRSMECALETIYTTTMSIQLPGLSP